VEGIGRRTSRFEGNVRAWGVMILRKRLPEPTIEKLVNSKGSFSDLI
jgi:hypothetical protein